MGGVSIMLLACVALANEVGRRPVLFAGYIRLCTIVLATISLIGVVQFVCANAAGRPEMLSFSFLNRAGRAAMSGTTAAVSTESCARIPSCRSLPRLAWCSAWAPGWR